MATDNRVTIKIPRQLYNTLKDMIAGTGFSSVNEFIVYVMRDIASGGRLDQETGLSKEEVDLIRKRLRALGYLPDEAPDEARSTEEKDRVEEETYSVQEEEKIKKRLKDLGYI